MTHPSRSREPSHSREQYSYYFSQSAGIDAAEKFAPRRAIARTATRSSSPKSPSLPPTPPPTVPSRSQLPMMNRPPVQPVYPPSQPVSVQPRPRRRSRVRRRSPRNFLLAGGSMLALAGLMVGPKPIVDRGAEPADKPLVCQEKVQAQSVLSRAELSELLTIGERAPKGDVRAVVQEPYCILPAIAVREGVTAQREVYPLEFNPETWLIVLYEGEEYAGFDFSFTRE